MSRKRIGIPGWKVGDNSFGCSVTYLDFISKFGDPVIIMPADDLVKVDMVLMPGGPDADANTYGQSVGFFNSMTCPHRQAFATHKLPAYIEAGTPIFGICLGFQMLNVHFGGTLTQDLTWHAQSKDRYAEAHPITIMENKVFMPDKVFVPNDKKNKGKAEVEGEWVPEEYKVNSHHHQAVCISNIAPNLGVLALAYNEDETETQSKGHDKPHNDYIVEAFMHNELPIAGVQWHPEELHDRMAISIIKHLLGQ